MNIILKNISNVGELTEALSKLPPETGISPFGSENCKLVYDEENKVAYIDEDFGFLEEEDC
jgi:hypothetical protein